MERMSSWSVKGRVPATAATVHQTFSEILQCKTYGSDLEPGNGAAANSRVPHLLDLPVNAKK